MATPLSEPVGLIDCKTAALVPLVGVEVDAEIAGRSSMVKIAQKFCNREKVPVEAVYKFPLTEAASICGFRARVGEKVIEGNIEERDKAFEKYDEALEAGHGGYLLDEERPNIFTLSVGNLNPGAEAILEIEYVTLLETHGREVRFSLPTTISPRYLPADTPDEEGIPVSDKVNPRFELDVPYGLRIHLRVHGRDGIESVESPSHCISQSFREDALEIGLTADEGKLDRDFVVNVQYREAFKNRAYLWEEERGRFIQVDCAPEIEGEKAGGREIVFLLDCSGSMSGSSIQQARNALSILLKALDQGTRFNIVRFGSTYETLFKSSRDYGEKTLKKALTWLSRVTADLGGTEILKPLDSILERGWDRSGKLDVVVLTDGEVGNETQILELVQENAPRVRIFPIGIGHGPNEYFIRQLARSSQGASEMIAPGERIEARTLRLFGKLRGVSVDKVSIGVKGGGQQSPERVSLFTGETRSIFLRLTGEEAPEKVRVHGQIGDSDWEVQIPVSRIESRKSVIATLWARERIRELEEDPDKAGRGSRQTDRKSAQIRGRIIELSKEFGLVSRYASFVAVEERSGEELTRDEAQLRKVPVMLTADWHGLEHRFGDAGMRMPGQELFSGYGEVLLSLSCEDAGPMPAQPMREASRRPLRSFFQKLVHHEQHEESRDLEIPADLVHAILAQQRAEGGLNLDPSWTGPSGIDEAGLLRDTARSATRDVDWQVLLATSLALALLVARYSDRREEWEAVVEKSRHWLSQQIASAQPMVDGTPLEEWAAEYVKRCTLRL